MDKCKTCSRQVSLYCIHCVRYELNALIDAYFDDFYEPTNKASVNRITLKSTTSPVPAPEEPVPVKVTSAESA